jgi:hypothetical protein
MAVETLLDLISWRIEQPQPMVPVLSSSHWVVEAPAFKTYASQEQGTRESNGGPKASAGPRILKRK